MNKPTKGPPYSPLRPCIAGWAGEGQCLCDACVLKRKRIKAKKLRQPKKERKCER